MLKTSTSIYITAVLPSDYLGKLVREDNTKNNETYVYTYDNAGNILTKKTYALTAANSTPSSLKSTYSYGYSSSDWGDLLTSYRGVGITYDGIGNPLSYYNGTSYSFSWTGRELSSAIVGGKSMSFSYNSEGIRTTKTVSGVTTTYYLSGSRIIAEQTPSYTVIYLYEADGSPFGFQYISSTSSSATAWESYVFEKNLQGDIVAVYDPWGAKYISYSYDAWGNATVTYHNGGESTIAAKNPFRYRGYYYDSDLGLYYNNTRYYDSKTGRFISPDSIMAGANGTLHGFNLYVYCFNNPNMYTDSSGNWPEWVEKVAKWFKETFGAGVVQSQKYEEISAETLLFGYEKGASSSKVIAGEVDKPVSFFATNASNPSNFFEYGVGIQFNTENGGGFALSLGIGEFSFIASNGSNSTQGIIGINKIGITQSIEVDFGKRTAGDYYHEYVRSIPLAGVAILTYYTGGTALPVFQ